MTRITLDAARASMADALAQWVDTPAERQRTWLLVAAEIYRRTREGD